MARNSPAKRTLSDITSFSNRVRQRPRSTTTKPNRRNGNEAAKDIDRMQDARRRSTGEKKKERETIFFRGEYLNCITMQAVAPGMQRVSARRRKGREDRREIASTKTKTRRDEKNRARSFAKRNAATKRTRGKRKRERGRERAREHEGERGRPN